MAITLVSPIVPGIRPSNISILLGVVQGVTEEPIAKAKEAEKQEAYKQVLSEADICPLLVIGDVT